MTTMSAKRWFHILNPNPGATLRLFAFPYAGGAAMIYRGWPDRLPGNIEVCAVQLPGRGSRLNEPPYKRISAVAQAVADEITPLLDKPFAFFGHSMGALISFEMSRLLRERLKMQPTHLCVSGRQAPHIKDEDTPTFNLPDEEFIKELHRLNGTPKEALEHPELMAILLPLLRADFEMVQTYDYTEAEPLDCPLTAFGGLQDREVSRESLQAWRQHTTSSFALRMLPGDHFFINSQKDAITAVLAQVLSAKSA